MTIDPVPDSVLSSKTILPESGQVFSRPALFTKLRQLSSSPRKVWISSPGGAGKTTLVREFLSNDPRPIIWYRIDHSDQDPANLFICLAQLVQKATSDTQVLPPLMPEYMLNIGVYCRNFFRALFAKFEAGCVLVFDDLQDGPGESLFGTVLSSVFSELPEHSSFFMLSREEPYPQFARQRIHRSLAYLGWDDLSLSFEETQQFLTWSTGKEPLPQVLDRAYEITHGWMAGLLLFLDSHEATSFPQEFSFDRVDLLFDYFASEIFARLSAGVQRFLLTCGFLPTVEVSMAEALTARADAGDTLRKLARENHFTFRISTIPEVYSFHPLFRQFLLSRANQCIDTQQRIEIRERSASLLLDEGQVEAASDLLIQAQAWPMLIELITVEAETLLKQGRLLTLFQWLDAIPQPLRCSDPWLSYWFGSCLLAKAPLDAQTEFIKAFELFEQRGDIPGSMQAWVMAVNAIITGWNDFGELDQWITHFSRLQASHVDYPSPEIEALMVQGSCRALMWRQPANPDLPRLAGRLYQLVTTSSDSRFRLLAGSNLAFYHIIFGETATSLALVGLLNSDLDSAEVTPLDKLTWLATRAVLETVLLDSQGCLATIELARSLIAESGVHAMDLRLFSQGISIGLTTGDLVLVQQLFDELPTVSINAALDHSYSCHLLADFNMLQGDATAAIALAELALSRAKDGGSAIHISISLAGLILPLYYDGQIERTAMLLEEGMRHSQSMSYFSAIFHLLAAFFALEHREESEALDLLRIGFGIASRHGYLNFHPWRDEIMIRLCREAVSAGIHVDYVNRLASCHKLDITQSEMPNLTTKEIEVLKWVEQGKTTWEIARIQEISERTVKFHVGNVLGKLGVKSRFQAVAVAVKLGILNQD